ncbi:Glycosyl transferase [Microbacterium sp. 8M]|nr:Glycosyl transferase [Microbacterium sp. 8M]
MTPATSGNTRAAVRGTPRRKVLVARLDSMGDVIVAGPAIRAIAARAEVTLLAGPQGAEAGSLLPGVDEVVVWACPWILDPAPPMTGERADELLHLVRARGFDEAVILTSFHQSPLPLALLLRLAGVPRISGASVDHAGALLDVRLRPGEDLPEDIPEPERAAAIAAAAGYPPVDDGRLRLRPLPDTTALTGPDPYLVLHPGAAVPARRWPVQRFAAAATLLAAAGHRIVVTGGPGERDDAAAVCAAAPARTLDLSGACTLAELAGVLARAGAVVVGNTGPAHLAAAVGTPIVSLFSPVVPAVRWAPYGVPVALFGDEHAACRGTRARVCPVPGHPCLSGVRAEDVAAAATRLAAVGRRAAAATSRDDGTRGESARGAVSSAGPRTEERAVAV